MAHLINDEDIYSAKRQGNPIYPWDEWLDGQARMLIRGEDFQVSIGSMRAQLSTRASKAGGYFITRAFGGGKLAIKFMRPSKANAPEGNPGHSVKL